MLDCVTLILEATRAARRLPGTPDRRDDLVQETLLRLWSRRDRIEDGPTRSLVAATLKRIRIDWWRRERPHEGLHPDAHVTAQAGPFDDASLAELRRALRAAVHELPREQAEVVRLRVEAGKSFAEIAAIQKVPLNTALGRMHLALRRLRAALEDRHDDTT